MSVRDLLGGIVNRAPVSLAPRYGNPLTGHIGYGSSTDRLSQLETMGSVGTLFGIVNKTTTTTASVDWKLWRKSKSGKKEDRKEIVTHPALVSWNKPNNFYTRQELVESVQQHIDLTGEGWLVYDLWEGLGVREIWFVRPDRIAPVPHPQDFIAGYVYTSPNGEKIPLSVQQVSQIKMPNPTDMFRGMGPVQAIMHNLDSTRYSAQWNRNFFLNSAEPGGIVKIPAGMSDPQFEQLVQRWNANHRGISNVGRVAFLENAEYEARQFSQRDMQFVELATLSADQIREAFGFPKFAQGIVDDVNRATAEASDEWYAKTITVPRLDRWKGMLNNDYLPLFNNVANLEFDYESPVSISVEEEDKSRTSKVQAYAILVREGVDPVDAAQVCGLPPMRVIERQPAPLKVDAIVGNPEEDDQKEIAA